MNRSILCFLLAIAVLLSLSACSKQKESEETESLYFMADGAVYKRFAPLRENQVQLAADKLNLQIDAHPEVNGVYLAVIPDKSCYVSGDSGHTRADYDEMVDIICSAVPDAQYIDIFGVLSAGDYYRTDLHWRQERILTVAEALCAAMGAAAPEKTAYTKTGVGEFTGVLASQSGLEVKPEMLSIMESAATKSASAKDYEDNPLAIYSPEKLDSTEPYDVFLSGAQPVITIENPGADTDRKLVIFRDSFGSSIAPLLLSSYSRVTLVDLRYIMGSIVSDYVSFDGADLLFLYSEALLNSGGILK